MRTKRIAIGAIATGAVSLALATAATADEGDLTGAGCFSGVMGVGCGPAVPGLSSVFDVAVSPDGASVYAISNFSPDAIVRFDRAPSGALSNPSCIEDVESNGPCDDVGLAGEAQGLGGATGLAVSADGTSVYVAGSGDDAIVRFDRAPSGALSNPSCIEDVEINGPCDDVPAGEAQGLNGVRTLAVSPGGTSLYAVSNADDAIVRFDRAPSGALSNPVCIEDVEANGACDDAGPAGEAQGLNGAINTAVSPDGASVYVAGQADDAIVRFDRAAAGALSNPSCIEDVEANGACDDAGPAGETQGLNDVVGLAVSPDGANVYAGAFTDDAVVRFDRAASGALSNATCVADVGSPVCPISTHGLNGAEGVAVSPDSGSIYAVSENDSAIVHLEKAANGGLDREGCISEPPGDPGTCGLPTVEGMFQPFELAISPDGANVYVGTRGDDAIVRFDRELPPTPPPTGPTDPGPGGGDTDSLPPDTTITSGPKSKEKKGKATFAFISTEAGSTFECSLDGGAFEPCGSPRDVKVKKGKHTFSVRARDTAGNADPTPASQDWTVKKKKKK